MMMMMMMITTTTTNDLHVLDPSKPPSQRNQIQKKKCSEHYCVTSLENTACVHIKNSSKLNIYNMNTH